MQVNRTYEKPCVLRKMVDKLNVRHNFSIRDEFIWDELDILGVKRVFIFLLLILVLSYHFMSFITSNPGQKRVLIYCYERCKS